MSSEENKRVVYRVFEEIISQGHIAEIETTLAEDFVLYDPAVPQGIHGQEGFKQFISGMRAAFPDVTFTVEDLITEGEKVAARWTMHGTQRNTFNGIPPTNTYVTFTGMYFFLFANSWVKEIRVEADVLGMLRQLEGK